MPITRNVIATAVIAALAIGGALALFDAGDAWMSDPWTGGWSGRSGAILLAGGALSAKRSPRIASVAFAAATIAMSMWFRHDARGSTLAWLAVAATLTIWATRKDIADRRAKRRKAIHQRIDDELASPSAGG